MSVVKLFNEGTKPMKTKSTFFLEEDILALRKRNEQRALEARLKMGDGWSCHPKNSPQNNGRKSVLS